MSTVLLETTSTVSSSPLTQQSTHHSQTIDSYGDTVVIFVVGIVLTFITCVIGTFGNSICIVVLFKLAIRGSKCPLYIILMALAFSDSAVLILNFWTNILSIGLPYTKFTATVPLYLNHGNIIRVFWPLLMGAQMASIYLTVLVSYERWLAVVKPIRASQRHFSYKKLSMLIGGIVALSIVYNIPRWLEYEPMEDSLRDVVSILPASYFCHSLAYNQSAIANNPSLYAELLTERCNITLISFTKTKMGESLVYRYGYCTTLYILVMFLVPFIIITYMNIALVKCVKKSRRKWGTMSRSQRKEVQLSYIPLAIVCLFYILGLPAVIINFVDSLNVAPSDRATPGFELWQAALNVSNFFVILNSAINFLIYCFLGKKFRSTLAGLCGLGGSTSRRSLTTASTIHHHSKSVNMANERRRDTFDEDENDKIGGQPNPNSNSLPLL